MKFTLSWLKEHLETSLTTDKIGYALTTLGLEVENIDDPTQNLSGFVIGSVQTAEAHPDAHKLRVCSVDTGEKLLKVVCGAPNVRAGLKVAVALPGCVIPSNGETLKRGVIRGQESQGMLCSSQELMMGSDEDGILELPPGAPVGKALADFLPLDPIFDIAITPNRGDCLGVRGIARDLAAAGFGALRPDTGHGSEPIPAAFSDSLSVVCDLPPDQKDACPHFVARHIRGIANGESPQWLKDRLVAVGLRPISRLVDIANYIMVGWNRPLHVFDAAKIDSPLAVRFARDGEVMEDLTGRLCSLDSSMVVIADHHAPHAVGGIIGGMVSSCTPGTTDIVIESALFDPRRIARAGRSLNVFSDARHRFERGIDPQSAHMGIELATGLILDLCGGEAGNVVSFGEAPSSPQPIILRPEKIEKTLGVSISADDAQHLLNGIGVINHVEEGKFVATPPSWRTDLTAEHDLVEEIARLNGYEKIPAVSLPRPSVLKPILTPRQQALRCVRRSLATRGLNETVTWSFMSSEVAQTFGVETQGVALANPMSSDLDILRPLLLPNLVEAVRRNASRSFSDTGFFEIGPQFHGSKPGEQSLVVCGVRSGKTGPRHWDKSPRTVDVFDARADAIHVLEGLGIPTSGIQIETNAPNWYHPGRSGSLRLGKTVLGTFGELHPRVCRALAIRDPLVGFEIFMQALPTPRIKADKARPPFEKHLFQRVERDFAFIVDTCVPVESLLRAARGCDKQSVSSVSVFDVYQGEHVTPGKKSVALTVTLQPHNQTFSDQDIDVISQKIITAVESATGGIHRIE